MELENEELNKAVHELKANIQCCSTYLWLMQNSQINLSHSKTKDILTNVSARCKLALDELYKAIDKGDKDVVKNTPRPVKTE